MAPLRPEAIALGQRPADLPFRAGLSDCEAQAAYLSDALASDDPALVVLALKEIGTARRIPVALDDNPQLGEVLRTVRELGLGLGAMWTKP